MSFARRSLVSLFLIGCGAQKPAGVDGGSLCQGPSTQSPPNVLQNAAFECDNSTAEWSAVFGTLDIVPGGRTGRAAKLTVDASGGRFFYTPVFAATPGSKSYCFTAWVQGTSPYMRMRVVLSSSGGAQDRATNEPVTTTWQKLAPFKVDAQNASQIQLAFEAQTNRTDDLNAKPGDTLWVDDVDVWETMGNCGEAR